MPKTKKNLSRVKGSSLFKVGSLFNPIKVKVKRCCLLYRKLVLLYPSRLDAMAIDPSKIDVKKNFKYTPGEILFVVPLFKKVTLTLRKDSAIAIDNFSKRRSLIMHSAFLMKRAIGFKEGFDIKVDNENEIKHCGLGSSSSLIAAVACAFNEAYGNPIPRQVLITYLAQNHGEEIDGNEEYLVPVQCIGGSAAGGIEKAGMIVLAGESVPIAEMKIPASYEVVIGIPKDVPDLDAAELMAMEKRNLHRFVATGKKWGKDIAYLVLHEVLPSVVSNDLSKIGDVIYKYRFEMGSIENCSFTYPGLTKLCDDLRYLKKDNIADVLAISSVGPGIFAITKNPRTCIRAFRDRGMKTFSTHIWNGGYRVTKAIKNV